MTTDTGPHVRISLDTIYGEIVALRAEVAALNVEGVTKTVEDHETRIRALERQAWKWAGAAAVLGVIGSRVLGVIFPS